MATPDTMDAADLAAVLNNGLGGCFYQLRDRALRALGESTDGGHVMLLTGCHAGAGVTTVAVNFARAACQSDNGKVLIVDACGVNGAIHQPFGIPPGPGLADHVSGRCDLAEAIQSSRWKQLDVLPAGSVAMEPSEMIRVSWLDQFLGACRRRYALTIIDAAPVMESNTTALLAAAAEGTILVIRAERERWEVAQRAVGLMRDAGARVIGAVLNRRKHHIPRFLYDWV